MSPRTVRSTSSCLHPHRCAAPPDVAHAPAGLSLRLSLRAPALRWAAAAFVAVAGRCTVIAHMEPLPAPPTAQAPNTEAPSMEAPAFAAPAHPLPPLP